MKQCSSARLTRPLMGKPGSERGDGEFVGIGWDEAFGMLEQQLKHIRGTDPRVHFRRGESSAELLLPDGGINLNQGA